MNNKEIRNLLKIRKTIVAAKIKLEEAYFNETASPELVCIYKQGVSDVNRLIYELDEQCLNWCNTHPVGGWLLRINGMTVDLATGLLAYFDVTGKEYAAQFIKYAGVDDIYAPHNKDVQQLVLKVKDRFLHNPDSMYAQLRDKKYRELLKDVTLDISKIHLRADRYMLKIFLAHLFEEMYREEHNGMLPERHSYDNCIIIEPEVPYTR